MSNERLAAGLEATAFLRRAEAAGGFGAVLQKGDEARGSLLLLVLERGAPVTFVERSLGQEGRYGWTRVGPPTPDSETAAQYAARRRKADPDCWILELDIPLSERFIAETIAEG